MPLMFLFFIYRYNSVRDRDCDSHKHSSCDYHSTTKRYSTLLVTCPVTSVKLQIANYFLLTANLINEILSTIIGLAVSKK